MEKEMSYEEASIKILELLQELLMSLKLQEGAIWAVFAMLPKPEQQYDLMEWLVKKWKNGETLTQEIIMEKVESMED